MKIDFDFSNRQAENPPKGSMAEAGNFFYKAGRFYILYPVLLILQAFFIKNAEAMIFILILSFLVFIAGSYNLIKGGECLINYKEKE